MNLRLSCVLLAGFISICTGCTPPSPTSDSSYSRPKSPVTASELDLAFQREDVRDVIDALNEVKGSPLNSDVIEIVLCAYEGCSESNSRWNSDALSAPLVRINLIDVLIQAGRRGFDNIDEASLRKVVVSTLGDSTEEVKQRCLTVLSYLRYDQDIGVIEGEAMATNNMLTYRTAIIALIQMNSPKADEAIERILQESSGQKRNAVQDLLPRQ